MHRQFSDRIQAIRKPRIFRQRVLASRVAPLGAAWFGSLKGASRCLGLAGLGSRQLCFKPMQHDQPCPCITDWQRALRTSPEKWFIRSVPGDIVWFSDSCRRWLGMAHFTQFWSETLNWVYHGDAHRIEDAFSLALKTDTPQEVRFRLKLQPDRLVPAWNCITPWRCNCSARRTLFIVLLCPAVPQDGQPYSFSCGELQQ